MTKPHPITRREAVRKAAAASACLGATLISGCSSRRDPSGKITLMIWSMWSGGEEEAFLKVMRRYEELNPHIHIENLGSVRDDTKTIRAIVAGVPPDLFTLSDALNVGPLAAQGALTRLDTKFSAAGLKEESFLPASLSQGRFRDGIYSLPFLIDGTALMWNKRLFREAGLDPEEPPGTWEDLCEYARKLTKKDAQGGLLQLGLAPLSNRSFNAGEFFLLGNLFGGSFFDAASWKLTPDDPKIVHAIEEYKRLIDDLGGYTAVNAFAAGFGQAQGGNNPFFMGKVAMMFNGQWNPYWAQEYAPQMDYGVGPPPAPAALPDYQGSAWLGGNYFCLPTGCPHPEEAWKLMVWMQSPEAQRLFADTMHGIPNQKAVLNEPSLKTGEPWRAQYGKFFDYALRPHTSHFPVTEVSGLYYNSLTDAFDIAMAGQKTPQQAMTDVRIRVQRELERYR